MPPETANPARAGDTPGLGKTSFAGSVDAFPSAIPSPKVQAVIADLKRQFICECLRIVALKASHAADNLDFGDDVCAERDIGIAVSNMREGAAAFRELQKLEAST